MISTFPRPEELPPSTSAIPQDQDLRKYRSEVALEAVAKRQTKSFSRSSPVKLRSGIFPRRPSGSRSRTKTTEAPLFVPDEEDDAIPQVVHESEGDEWEDFDGELEEDVQMSIAIAESLESQHRTRRISDPRPLAHAPLLETPAKPPRRTNKDNNDKPATDDEDEFTSPSRLETQLSIAGARKPLSTRIPSDSTRGTAIFATGASSVSPMKSRQNPVANPTLDRPPDTHSESGTGDKDESDEDDDMEEVSIPQPMENRPPTPETQPALGPPKSLVNPHSALVTNPVETPLAIGVEDVVAKRFAEFQKIFAEKRKAFRAENPQVQEEIGTARELLREESPGLEYADAEVVVPREAVGESMKVRSSPHPQSDEDEDMEEVEVVPASPLVPSRDPKSSVQSEPAPSFQLPPTAIPAAVAETFPLERAEEGADGGDEEEVPISDWSRSPSPRPRPSGGEAGPSTSGMALDRSRGLLDPDESFDQGPPGEQDQEQEAFDAAHEMDADAEAGEFARWMSQVKGRDLDDVRKEIEQEINGLRKEQKAAMRDSEDITGQMIAQIMVSLGHPPSKLIILDVDLILPSLDDAETVWDTLHHGSNGSRSAMRRTRSSGAR